MNGKIIDYLNRVNDHKLNIAGFKILQAGSNAILVDSILDEITAKEPVHGSNLRAIVKSFRPQEFTTVVVGNFFHPGKITRTPRRWLSVKQESVNPWNDFGIKLLKSVQQSNPEIWTSSGVLKKKNLWYCMTGVGRGPRVSGYGWCIQVCPDCSPRFRLHLVVAGKHEGFVWIDLVTGRVVEDTYGRIRRLPDPSSWLTGLTWNQDTRGAFEYDLPVSFLEETAWEDPGDLPEPAYGSFVLRLASPSQADSELLLEPGYFYRNINILREPYSHPFVAPYNTLRKNLSKDVKPITIRKHILSVVQDPSAWMRWLGFIGDDYLVRAVVYTFFMTLNPDEIFRYDTKEVCLVYEWFAGRLGEIRKISPSRKKVITPLKELATDLAKTVSLISDPDNRNYLIKHSSRDREINVWLAVLTDVLPSQVSWPTDIPWVAVFKDPTWGESALHTPGVNKRLLLISMGLNPPTCDWVNYFSRRFIHKVTGAREVGITLEGAGVLTSEELVGRAIARLKLKRGFMGYEFVRVDDKKELQQLMEEEPEKLTVCVEVLE